jgi:hypothetical protein
MDSKPPAHQGGCHCGRVRFRVYDDLSSITEKIDVNVRCLEGVDLASLRIIPFDGRNWEHAFAKRTPLPG